MLREIRMVGQKKIENDIQRRDADADWVRIG